MYKLLVLADGPCSADSFRPMDDARQWWARRDALTRIMYAQSQGQRFSDGLSESFSYVMFHDGNPTSTEERGVHVMAVSNRQDASVSEFDLISAMKKASKGSSLSSKFIVQPSVSCKFLTIEEETVPVHRPRSSQKQLGKFDNLSKKEILAKLQSSCSMDFLRNHHLNASTEAILKKRNTQQLQDCWKEWDDSVANGHESDGFDTASNKCDEIKEQNRLIAAYGALFRDAIEEWRMQHVGKGDPIVTVLLLHEDYKYELPVFRTTHGSNPEDNTAAEIVLCVMGAVRDMTAMESMALAQAVRQQGASLVVANLGRTAEFTSKIVMALRAHALHNHTLLFAVRELRNRQSLADQAELLNKLASSRSNQSTWNGYETTTAVAAVTNKSSEPNPSASTTIDTAMYPQCLVVAVSVPFTAESLSLSLENRQRWLPYVRFIVFTMWKSRVVSDSTDATVEKKDVQNILHMTFACGLQLKINQACITEEVTTHHCPAPSEYQIMAMLQRLIAQAKPSLPPRSPESRQHHHEHTIIKGVLEEVGTLYAEAVHRPEIYTVCLSNVPATHGAFINGLSEAVYSSPCWCQRGNGAAVPDAEEESAAATDVPRVLLVFVNMSPDTQSRSSLSAVFESTMETMSNIPRKLRKRILAGIMGPVNVFPSNDSQHGPLTSDAFRICAMQHWAYHGRLFPALAALKVQEVTPSILDKKDAKKKKKRKKHLHHGEPNESDDEAVSKKKSKKGD